MQERCLYKRQSLFAKIECISRLYMPEYSILELREMSEKSFLRNLGTIDRCQRELLMNFDERTRVILLNMVLDDKIDLFLPPFHCKCVGNTCPHLGRVARVHIVDKGDLFAKDKVTVI